MNSRGSLMRRAVAVCAVAAVIVFGIHMLQFGRYIADDAAITFAYAKNLAAGHGLVLNPGTDPVEGYSNFGWLLVVLPFCARGVDPTVPVKILSSLLGAVTVWLVALTGARLSAGSRRPADSWLGAAAALGLAAFTPYVVWASSGLENGLYGALFMGALWLYLKESYIGCALALVGLSLTRVEGAGIAGLFALHRAFVLAFSRTKPSRAELTACLAFLSLYGAYTGWHWWYFRAWLPNSYLAKSQTLRGEGSVFETLARGWAYAYGQLIVPYRFAFVAPVALAGLVTLKARSLTLMALLVAGVSALVVMTGGDFYPQFRLGTLFLPLWFLLLTEGGRLIASFVRPRAAAAIVVLVPLVVVCQPSLAASSNWGVGPISMGALKPELADRYVEFSKGIRRRPMTVMESDIGNVAYFTNFAVLDLGGLANLQIARSGFAAPFFLHQVFDEIKPDVIHLRGLFAANARIPIALIERDYRTVEGLPTGAYAEGWYVRRDSEAPSPSPAPAKAGAEVPYFPTGEAGAQGYRDVIADVERRCAQDPDACHADRRASLGAQSRADAYRRRAQYAEAFGWYRAAWEADRRNIVALRAREEMRQAAWTALPR